MEYDRLHEKEVVSFIAESPKPIATLRACLLQAGFTLHDDVFSLDRKGRVPPWQHSAVAEVKVLNRGEEIFEQDGEWDQADLEYLFAFLPSECQEKFLDAVDRISECLGLPPHHQGRGVDRADLKSQFEHCLKDLEQLGEVPGSETLAILIQDTYPR
ncbi:hypothetical protein OOT46_04015 [Aquabacterium sp. A7-Y]|uniref:hypothetical protein n=1 Tax=Aquabacterium sp. A7-Y TaxID=1349605 RepID=UPI00223D6ED8|nr:hypothetical protein [Aquabacterium sp. A7-Y]MCW7537019.1 hypothetical protein [Aquabacterium sp. A7-Y]